MLPELHTEHRDWLFPKPTSAHAGHRNTKGWSCQSPAAPASLPLNPEWQGSSPKVKARQDLVWLWSAAEHFQLQVANAGHALNVQRMSSAQRGQSNSC